MYQIFLGSKLICQNLVLKSLCMHAYRRILLLRKCQFMYRYDTCGKIKMNRIAYTFLSTYKYSMLLSIKNWPRSEILAVGKRGEHQRLVRK